jgi:hypothetical protein
MMKQRALPSHEEITARARHCVQVFLYGTVAKA